jgi:hypothetical protein
MEPKLFLKLERAHCGETAKVMMQSRSAHSCQGCKLIHVKRRLKVFTQPTDGPSRSIALVCQRCDRTRGLPRTPCSNL